MSSVPIEEPVEAVAAGTPAELAKEAAAVDGQFHGRVVATDGGAPIAGAIVVVQELQWIEPYGTIPVFITDEQGRFRLSLETAGEKTGCVRAADFGPAFFEVDGSAPSVERERIVRLPRAAVLRGVVWPIDPKIERTTVMVEVPAFDANRRLSFVLTEDLRRADVDASGRFELRSLQPDAPLDIRVLCDDRVVLRLPVSLVLEPGEQRDLDLELGRPAPLVVTVRNRAGQVLADLEVALYGTDQVSNPKQIHSNLRPARCARSDAAGRATFEDLALGKWIVAPGASCQAAGWVGVACEAVVGIGAELATCELILEPCLWIEGRVLWPEGADVQMAAVMASSGQVHRQAQAREDGSYRVGPLVAGAYQVFLHAYPPTWIGPGWIDVEAGSSGVDFVLIQSASFLARLVHTDGRIVDGGTILVNRTDAWWRSLPNAVRDQPITGIPPGRYDLTATFDGNWIATLEHVQLAADEAPTEFVFELKPSARLRVRCLGEDVLVPHRTIEIRSGSTLVATNALQLGTSTELEVPPGALLVHAIRHDPDGGPDEVRDKIVIATAEQPAELEFVW